MARIPRDFVNELLARVDIVELIGRRVSLKKAGSNFTARCPFHTEKTPSFIVNPQKQFYHCFGCGAHDNAIGFLINHDRLEFVEAVEILAQQCGMEMPQAAIQAIPAAQLPLYPLLQQAAQFYQTQLQHAAEAQNYLAKRGISAATIQAFQIGFAPAGWERLLRHLNTNNTLLSQAGLLVQTQGKTYDRFRKRIMFPIRDARGRIIAFGGRALDEELPKYLNSPETPLFHKGNELYGLYEARHAQASLTRIIIVEGYLDVISLHQAGITQAVGVLGTAISSTHLQRLLRHTPNLIFCFDGDRAGQAAAWRALETSLEIMHDGLDIRFLLLPQGEDPDSLIRAEGATAFEQRMSQALPLADFFYNHLCAQVDTSSIDGKAKLANLAKNLLVKLRPSVFQQLMLERLATLIGTKTPLVLEPTDKDVPPAPPPAASRRPSAPRTLSPMQLAIALLLQYPELGQQLSAELYTDLTMPGSAILKKLIVLTQSHPHISTGALLEQWRNSKVASQLAHLATRDLLSPASGAAHELHGSLEKMRLLQREQHIQTLMTKSARGELSDQEKIHLLHLLKERQAIA